MVTDKVDSCILSISKYTTRLTSEMSKFKDMRDELCDIQKTLDNILHGRLQVDTSSSRNITRRITDDGYINELQKILSVYPYEKKLSVLVSISEDLKEYASSLVSKREKLRDRIKLSPNTDESIVAMSVLKTVNKSLAVVGERYTFIVSMFFKYRKAMLNYIQGNTDLLVRAMSNSEGQVSDEFKDFFSKQIKKENFHADHEAMVAKLKRRA